MSLRPKYHFIVCWSECDNLSCNKHHFPCTFNWEVRTANLLQIHWYAGKKVTMRCQAKGSSKNFVRYLKSIHWECNVKERWHCLLVFCFNFDFNVNGSLELRHTWTLFWLHSFCAKHAFHVVVWNNNTSVKVTKWQCWTLAINPLINTKWAICKSVIDSLSFHTNQFPSFSWGRIVKYCLEKGGAEGGGGAIWKAHPVFLSVVVTTILSFHGCK